MKEALLILGDQLFPQKFYRPHLGKLVFMAEDLGLCTHFKYHKHKIIFFLSSMRTFADGLKEEGHKVHYHSFSDESFMIRFEDFLVKNKIEKVSFPEIQDKFFEQMVMKLMNKLNLQYEVLDSPMFLCSRQDFKNYLFYHPKPFMKSFYEGERRRLKILLSDKKRPVGGQWSYDVENRKKAPKELTNVEIPVPPLHSHVEEVKALVDKEFSHHPGLVHNFWLPTDRREALKNLRHFIQHHLKDFGPHSVISPLMNAGLITPKEVIDHVLEAYEKDSDIPLASVEGFIRQVMGWREFVRGIYQNYSEEEESKNFFKHERKLTKAWYEGTTGLPPVDDAIKKAQDFGYCHHIERLMVLSNVMLLSEVHPQEAHSWFMEMFVDSADWVMGPNVYGMGQFSDGGIFATKPYISGSNYILKMSDYKKGDWCDVWDGLFWRFIHKHKAYFQKNPRLNMMVATLDKMEPKRFQELQKLALEFIKNTTA